MLHKAWNSKGVMPYCFPRSSIKFQGHTVQNITAFDPNWAFPDYRPVAAFKSLRFALFLQCIIQFHHIAKSIFCRILDKKHHIKGMWCFCDSIIPGSDIKSSEFQPVKLKYVAFIFLQSSVVSEYLILGSISAYNRHSITPCDANIRGELVS